MESESIGHSKNMEVNPNYFVSLRIRGVIEEIQYNTKFDIEENHVDCVDIHISRNKLSGLLSFSFSI